ncbi:methyltransferase [Candidatus Kaiserbacteria bacterium RIFCSPLOWO2_01_FULL_53_17]|uniref:Methyltransferase n=1 Tax=Candidatus Kaiserbacteria bacterium RIFCSPLOWO2_01_FULL_53_17 TaxID=1798511 RepID=A0A1F6EGB7_9BACT|nr:MAG: methyltransferase [Candidatus Kaiserbacteria bacterium RIFCSPLOWO2_01_FULL_53_17]
MHCRLCLDENTLEFLDLGKQPLANKYPKKEEFEAEDFFPVKVFFCPNCKSVQLGTAVSRERMFEDYFYLSSVNTGLVRQYEAFAKTLSLAKFVVDIGSNDGISLKPLKELGVKAIGVEPSINVSKIANDAGLTTLTSFFDAKTAAQIEKEYGKPDVITGFSMFSHLEDPHQFIEDVKDLLSDDGRFILEIEYVDTILKNMSFERFYLDRISYYSVTSLENLFQLHGMYLSDVEETDSHGGSLRATAQKKGKGSAPKESVKRHIAYEAEKLTPRSLSEFGNEARTQISALRAKLEEFKTAGLKVAGFGAPARVSTLCNFGRIGPELIEFIVDETPLKQHRHSPGTHIAIVPMSHLEEHQPDVFLVFVHEYFDVVKKKLSGGNYRYLFPIPAREVH